MHTRKDLFLAVGLLFFMAGQSLAAYELKGFYDVRRFGAVGNGKVVDTRAIQAAIDQCASDGGGRVYLAGGIFLSGTLTLKSNVLLQIEAGAVLMGSQDLKDYPPKAPGYRSYTDNYTIRSLLYAEKVENISIAGRGTIDGQGKQFKGRYKVRPYMIRFVECKNVSVRDVRMINSPMWVQHYLVCENVNIDGITVRSHVNWNNDGIDIDSCNKVRIADCNIESGDDAIVLKSTSDRVCRNVTVTNCNLSSRCNAFKCGTESNGGFQNITVSNCTMHDTHLSGIALELVDGGVFDRVIISNITMKNVKGGIFVRLGNRARPFLPQVSGRSKGEAGVQKKSPGIGSMRNIIIRDVLAYGVGATGGSITGLPGHPVENVTLENIRIVCDGGGVVKDFARKIPEQENRYPEFNMFGVLPAYGLYVRHVKNLRLSNINITFSRPDQRPALVLDDVQDVGFRDFTAGSLSTTPALIWLKNVRGVLVQGCCPREVKSPFICVEGILSRDVTIINNDFTGVKQIYKLGGKVDSKEVFVKNNRF